MKGVGEEESYKKQKKGVLRRLAVLALNRFGFFG